MPTLMFAEKFPEQYNGGTSLVRSAIDDFLASSNKEAQAWPHRLARSRTPDFHSDNRGSNPLGVKKSL
jgi:hypothetical protein